MGREGDLRMTPEERNLRFEARKFAVQTALGRVNAAQSGETLLDVARPVYDFLVEDLDQPVSAPVSGSTVSVTEPTA